MRPLEKKGEPSSPGSLSLPLPTRAWPRAPGNLSLRPGGDWETGEIELEPDAPGSVASGLGCRWGDGLRAVGVRKGSWKRGDWHKGFEV